jgi:2-oxoglutarate dehydrogenase E2 component (dihydrolipoamide succinyltransferase)
VVEKDQEIAEIESEKATLPLIAEDSGKLKILAEEGSTVNVGDVACTIDTSVKPKVPAGKEPVAEVKDTPPATAATTLKSVAKSPADALPGTGEKIKVTPVAQKMMDDNNLSVEDIINGLQRIGKKEVETVLGGTAGNALPGIGQRKATRDVERKKMSQLRKKLGQRLVSVKNETAMLTTFNEVDMSEIIRLRKTYQNAFVEKYGIKLGFMSFFTKAVSEALRVFPHVNSIIEGEEIVTHHYADIGIAVQTEKGLMVPVLRNMEVATLAEIETQIMELANKARNNRISLDDLSGGTFTITNGGVFGSMLSTPILNPPQAAILGMHNIVDRPVAIDGKVEIRPIMYLALSYDHRLIDGKDSVSFLVQVKEFIESPTHILFGGADPDKTLLGI